mgnify:CR=1 FL=1
MRDGEPWFVAKDICDALGMPPTAKDGYGKHMRGLDDEDVTRHSKSGVMLHGLHQSSLLVSESGLYSLILKSRKPGAKAFKKWVTSVVLPAPATHIWASWASAEK